ncbi:hypothetical protein D3C81_834370 [compost metagenome]
MGEYMIKNFEAMACGCVLLAFDQGEEENRALGLQDMHNVVFYDSIPTLQEKLRALRADPALAQRIAENGRHLAVSRFSFGEVGRSIVDHMRPALRPHPPLSAWQRLRLKLGF